MSTIFEKFARKFFLKLSAKASGYFEILVFLGSFLSHTKSLTDQPYIEHPSTCKTRFLFVCILSWFYIIALLYLTFGVPNWFAITASTFDWVASVV